MARVAMTTCIVALLFVFDATRIVAATETPGCEGLQVFAAEVLEIRRAWVEDQWRVDIQGNKDPNTFTLQNWQDASDLAAKYAELLGRVDAPPWLEPWRDAWVALALATADFGKSIVDNDQFLMRSSSVASEKAWQLVLEAEAGAEARCDDFKQFRYDYDAMDSWVDGTFVIRPTPIPDEIVNSRFSLDELTRSCTARNLSYADHNLRVARLLHGRC